MKTKKEQNSKKYAEILVNQNSHPYVEKYGIERAKSLAEFDSYYIEEAFEEGWDKAKSELLKEVRDWFCNPYCKFYGLEDYCSTCPMNKEECWLKG